MCQRISCEECGKPTWAGCGEHIEDALEGVAMADRCPGHETAAAAPSGFLGGR